MGSRRRLFGKQVRNAQALFEAVDSDGSGSVDMEEMGAALRRLGLSLSRDDLLQLFATADKDCTGTVEWREFAHGLHIAHEDQGTAKRRANRRADARPPLDFDLSVEGKTCSYARCRGRARYYCSLCCAGGTADLDRARWYCGTECQGLDWELQHRE